MGTAKPWSWFGYGAVYVFSLAMAALLLPGLDALDPLRRNAFLAISGVYWIRFAVAKYRNETGRSYVLWMLVMALTPFGLTAVGLW